MSALSSSSTLTEIVNAYMDNASYAEDASAAKASAFVTACRILLLKRPKRVKHGQEEIELDMSFIANQLAKAESYAATAGQNSGGCRDLSFNEFRN